MAPRRGCRDGQGLHCFCCAAWFCFSHKRNSTLAQTENQRKEAHQRPPCFTHQQPRGWYTINQIVKRRSSDSAGSEVNKIHKTRWIRWWWRWCNLLERWRREWRKSVWREEQGVWMCRSKLTLKEMLCRSNSERELILAQSCMTSPLTHKFFAINPTELNLWSKKLWMMLCQRKLKNSKGPYQWMPCKRWWRINGNKLDMSVFLFTNVSVVAGVCECSIWAPHIAQEPYCCPLIQSTDWIQLWPKLGVVALALLGLGQVPKHNRRAIVWTSSHIIKGKLTTQPENSPFSGELLQVQ